MTPGAVDSGRSRRRFLGVAASSAFVGVGLAGARGRTQPATIRLGGEVGGWRGRVPESIADETNPTLHLEAGRTYRVVWENLDGMGHNFALLNGQGSVLQRTEVLSTQGETQTVEFTAREGIAEYVCEPHSTSMRGDVAFGTQARGTRTGNETRGGNEGTTAEPFIPKGSTVRIETLVDGGPSAPLDLAVPPGDGDRRFIVDRTGQVYVHGPGGLEDRPFIDVSGRLVDITGETGLLGMAFHPDFRQNRTFYLRYSAPPREGTPENFDHTEVLAEFRASEDFSTGVLDSERAILEIPSPQDTHNGGAVTFGPDGYLYLSMGDGGGGSDDNLGHASDWYEPLAGGNGQDVTSNLLGSILRIDVDNRTGDKPYAIPEDNPLVGREGLDEQFAWGFRNPWRMDFSDGKLFAADVGQNRFESVDIVENGKNYGWNVREGAHCFQPDLGPSETGSTTDCPTRTPPSVRGGERLVDPVIEYPQVHDGRSVGSAVIGGYVYENDAIRALTGKYVFGDFRKNIDIETPTGSLFAATPTDDGGLWELEELVVENTDDGLLGAFVLAIGRDREGELYVLTTDDHDPEGDGGALHRIVPPKQPSTPVSDGTTTGTRTTGEPSATASAPKTVDGGLEGTTDGPASGGESETTGTDESGPGFGVLAALFGLALGAGRLLAGDD